MKTKLSFFIALTVVATISIQCGGAKETKNKYGKPKTEKKEVVDPMKNKGIGAVKSITLATEIDEDMANKGKIIFEKHCTACHKVTKKFIGPAPKDILKRRTPEWVMNMIMNPDQMTKEDPIAKQLLIEANGAPMANQNISEEDARKILEYFRTL